MQTGIGPVAVRRVKLRDRGAGNDTAGEVGAERIRFTSATVTGFIHAVRLARLIEDAADAARTGLRRAARDWPSEVLPHDGHDAGSS